MIPTPIALNGAPGSPYTRKMVALLRYRRIPYKLMQYGMGGAPGMPKPKVQLLPTFFLPNERGELEAVLLVAVAAGRALMQAAIAGGLLLVAGGARHRRPRGLGPARVRRVTAEARSCVGRHEPPRMLAP